MRKTRKIVLGVVLGCVLLAVLSLGGLYYYKLNKILTIITIDINPSIKLSLNYKNDIVKAEGLNEDGKNLLKQENFKGDDLEDAIEEIVELSVLQGYVTQEENHILINIEGKDIEQRVVTLINQEFKDENVKCNVIVQEINANSKTNAEKYGISDSKASYIESIIKENENLTFEDLKDKTITEINQYLEDKKEPNKEEKVEEQTKEENNKQNLTTTNKNNSTSNKKPSTSSYVCPTSSANTNNVWCDYIDRLANESFAKKYNCPMTEKKDIEILRQMALDYLGIESIDARGQYGHPVEEPKASYCTAQKFIITTTETRTTLIMDSATGAIIKESKVDVPTPKISEEQAIDILLKHFNLSRANLETSSAWWDTDNEGANFVYRYSVYIRMTDGTQHTGSVNAMTGELYNIAY